ALKTWDQASRTEQYLPLALVGAELKELRERKLVGDWINANMIAVKDELDGIGPNKERKFRPTVERLIRQFGLTRSATANYYNRFTIAKAPELAELKNAFENDKVLFQINSIEGRQDASRLQASDFYRLFFRNESFSAGDLFSAKPWPPVVESKSEQPN